MNDIKKRGRKSGSYSFVRLSLADLLKKFADMETEIPVYTKWAETVGFKNLTLMPVSGVTAEAKDAMEIAAALKVTDLDAIDK